MQEAGLKDPTPLERKINEAERQRNERDGGLFGTIEMGR